MVTVRVSDQRLELLLDGARRDAELQTSGRYKREAQEMASIVSELIARRSDGLGTVSVKPLEWDDQWAENRSISGRTKRRIMERALTPFMAYFIEQSQDDDSWWVVEWLLGDEIAGPFEHCWQARAACDADFETRVKSCLTSIGVEAGK